MLRCSCTLLVVCCFLAFTTGAEIWVMQDGSDNDGCGEYSKPCASIGKGVEAACNSSSAELNTVWVAQGQYYNGKTIEITCSLSIRYVTRTRGFPMYF